MNLLFKIKKNTANFSKDDFLTLGFFLSIFTPLIVSNILLVLCFLAFFTEYKKNTFQKNISLFIPIVFFIWISLSYFWSINPIKTLNSIPRQLFFIGLPLFFIFKTEKNKRIKNKSLEIYSLTAVLFSLLFLIRAVVRFIILKNKSVFFFHGLYDNDFGLVPKELNAVHVSVFIALAFLVFLIKENKSKIEFVFTLILLLFLVLLSSSNVLFITFLLGAIYFFFISKSANKLRLRNILILAGIISIFIFYKKIEGFVKLELKQNTEKGIGHNVINESSAFSNKITLYEAWNNEKFTPNDFFPGMAFRVYQTRVFFEILNENSTFWQGFGFNASQIKLEKKGIEKNIFLGNEFVEGYQKKNFHNQYLQAFAELGFVGFFLLTTMLVLSLKSAIKNKDFVHFSFTILMISLFLTESFLWRQRGVVFFTVFYSLFCMKNILKIKEK